MLPNIPSFPLFLQKKLVIIESFYVAVLYMKGVEVQERLYQMQPNKGSEELEQDFLRGGESPVPEDIRDQAGPHSEQPDLAADVHMYCRGVGLDDL